MSDVDQRLSRLSPLRLALMAQELRSQRALVNAEPIAIIGMGCRFPGGSDSPAALWRMLHDGVDSIREVPPERWDVSAFYDPDPDAPGKMYCKDGAFLPAIDQFDADFFGISPREAASMDPQQRILLEVSWEALEHAGQSPERLAGSSTGVFVGINATDYLLLQMGWGDPGRFNDYTGMGNSHSVAVGRLSYLMGLRGPSMAVDTACSSSLLAVHLACQSLRNEECDLALAGGVNLVLVPEITVSCCRFRMLSPDGRCKTFDAAANGYVRGEGCGMVVLKRYSDALADGDHVLALVRGSAANQDGRSNGLTAPSGAAQQDVIRRALASGGVDPHQIGYLEAHGTGTPLGDPIEFDSMAAVLATDRAPDNPLVVGSVKTNIGHLETAAGIAGLMKAVLALHHQEIPPHLNLKTLSPHISATGANVQVATQLTPWQRSAGRRRLAGVSSFGFSGTNVHAILEEAPARERNAVDAGPQLLTLSAQTATALTKLATRFADHFAHADATAFADDCYTANNGRSRFRHRLALVADSPQQAGVKLAAFAAGDASAVVHGVVPDGVRGKPPADVSEQGVARLESLAALFVQGIDVNLEAAEDEARPRKTHLPTYPFERRRFWLEPALRVAPAEPDLAEAASPAHPLLGRRLQSPLREIIYQARIGPQSPPYLNDHRVQDSVLFPATGYIEMALAASLQIHGSGVQAVEHLAIAEPLLLPSEGRATVQCVVTPEGVDHATFRIFSLTQDTWTLHASGTIARRAGAASFPPPEMDGAREVQPDHHYRSLRHLGLEYGPAFRRLTRLRRRDMAAWGEAAVDASGHCLHPALLDACLHVLMAAVPHEQSDAGYLPVGMESLTLHQSGVGSVSCVCLVRAPESGSPDLLRGDIRIVDDTGALVAELIGFTCRRSPRLGNSRHRVQDSLYHVVWQPRESAYVEEQEDAARWLILGGAESGAALGARLQRQGQECLYAAGDLSSALRGTPSLRGVIYLGALDGESASSNCAAVLQLSQNILHAHLAEPPRVILVTRGAQSVNGSLAPAPVQQAALWGLGRVIATEHPELHCLLMDLDPAAPAEAAMPALLEELFAPARDREVAIRSGERLVPRLVRYAVDHDPAPSRLRADATYVITGGLGALGLQVAERLAAKGARNLVLVGRSGVPQSARPALDHLESIGVRVWPIRCDVSSREDVTRLFAQIPASMPPVRGVVHAAGVVDDDSLIRQSASRVDAVLAPKVDGALHLHEAVKDMALDFFVLFSSIASLIGSRAQASYAAANASLDALAQHRREMGLPGLSINWGPWAGDGMAASLPSTERQRLAKRGIGFLSPGQALDTLEYLLPAASAQVAVFAADWAKLAQNPPAGADLALLSELLEEGRRLPSAAPRALFVELEQAAPGRRHGLLSKYITAQVLDILQFESSRPLEPSQGFFQIGMDSLMAVELQSRLQTALGVALSSTVSFDQPTIERLATHLLDDVLLEKLPRAPSAPLAAAAAVGMTNGGVDALSEDELLTLLNRELGSAEQEETV